MKEVEKLSSRIAEWNAIYPFLEWLSANKMCVAKWRDPEAPYYNAYKEEYDGTIGEKAEWLLEHPYPIGTNFENLLYEYFKIDPSKLEQERREILENLRDKQ